MASLSERLLGDFHPAHITKDRVLSLAVVFSAFLVTSEIGMFLYQTVGTSPSMIWAPIGIAFAAVILGGYAMLPAIFLAAAASALLNGSPLFYALIGAIANTVQPALGAYILEKTGFDRALSRVKDMFLMLVIALFVTMIVPTTNALSMFFYEAHYRTASIVHWSNWWVGGALSALVLTPFLIRWIHFRMTPRRPGKFTESVVTVGIVAVLSALVFGTTYTSIGGLSLLFPLMLALAWIAFRVGPRFMTLALFLMTVFSMWGAVYGMHLPPEIPLNQRIFSAQILDLFLSVIFFMLVSVEEQRKEVIKALKRNTVKLEEALEIIRGEERAKNEFIATLGHELRNPLATLMSSTELLALDVPAHSDARELIDIMHARVRTMAKLLDDLLDIARITRKEITIKKEPVVLSEAVRSALETVGHSMQKKEQTLSVSLPLEPVVLAADPVRLEQIFVNLLGNAIKYTPEAGHIDFTAKYHEGVVRIRIADTGVGIPPSMLERIFEPFVQVKETSGSSGGLGIGLSLTKTLIELHGGSISAKANLEGTGSAFLVTLPARIEEKNFEKPPRAKRSVLSPLSLIPSPNGLKILVVDDNEEAGRSLGKLLTIKGHDVSLAHTGKGALEETSKRGPDVVLLDLGLPDMSGLAVADSLKKSGEKAILIAVTGYGQEGDKERTREAGFSYHLTKPVGLSELESVLKRIKNKPLLSER